MPIKWSAVQVSEAMDMVGGFVRDADLPLEQAKIVATEAKRIADLPEYMEQRLNRLISDIERIDNVKDSIKAVLNTIPDGALEAERKTLSYGSTQSLV